MTLRPPPKKNTLLASICCIFGLALSGCHSSSKSVLSATTFDFGAIAAPLSSTRDVVTVTNTGKAPASISATVSGDPSLRFDPGLSCGASLLPGGSCSMVVSFSPTSAGPVSGSLAIRFSGGIRARKTVTLKGAGVKLSPGQSLVTPTANPLVALYAYQPAAQGLVHVEFGPTTSYGKITSSVATPINGGPVQIFVAGMRQNSIYHMRAVLTEDKGATIDDQDHTFTTGSFPADMLPTLSATTTPGQTPQPGIELLNASNYGDKNLQAYATDLKGNIIWGYNYPARASKYTFVQPIKQLPNGNFIVVLGYTSQLGIPGEGATLTPAQADVSVVREINLAGDPVQQLTLDSLNAQLAADGHGNIKLLDLHHDIEPLPNGHFIIMGSMVKPYTNLVGYPGTTNVLGDVLIGLDQNFHVDWVWSEFDHLNVNRHPIVLPAPKHPVNPNSASSKLARWWHRTLDSLEGKRYHPANPGFELSFPDWTHSNAIIYVPSDGDLLVSIRHQSWIIKIDYDNGKGTGKVLWRLGNGGNFKLIGGTAPQDWFYGEHQPTLVGTPTKNKLSLTMMDNGYGRILANGAQCPTTPSACYSTIPVMTLNEKAMTATITYHHKVPAARYNMWGGNAEILDNGDLEYDLCDEGRGSIVREIRMTHPAQRVWTLKESRANLYRAHRIPSLYPGVQW